MTLIEKLLKTIVNKDSYKIANLYVGLIAFNASVEFPEPNRYRLIKQMQGPIICYKAPLSPIYTRVSNGIPYLLNKPENNSLEVGDSYFDYIIPLIDFVHTHMYGLEEVSKSHYLDKNSIINIENLLQEHQAQQQEYARLEKQQ